MRITGKRGGRCDQQGPQARGCDGFVWRLREERRGWKAGRLARVGCRAVIVRSAGCTHARQGTRVGTRLRAIVVVFNESPWAGCRCSLWARLCCTAGPYARGARRVVVRRHARRAWPPGGPGWLRCRASVRAQTHPPPPGLQLPKPEITTPWTSVRLSNYIGSTARHGTYQFAGVLYPCYLVVHCLIASCTHSLTHSPWPRRRNRRGSTAEHEPTTYIHSQ